MLTKRKVKPNVLCAGENDSFQDAAGEYIHDFYCGYMTSISCEDCVCIRGDFDPRTDEEFIPIRVKVNKKRRKDERRTF